MSKEVKELESNVLQACLDACEASTLMRDKYLGKIVHVTEDKMYDTPIETVGRVYRMDFNLSADVINAFRISGFAGYCSWWLDGYDEIFTNGPLAPKEVYDSIMKSLEWEELSVAPRIWGSRS